MKKIRKNNSMKRISGKKKLRVNNKSKKNRNSSGQSSSNRKRANKDAILMAPEYDRDDVKFIPFDALKNIDIRKCYINEFDCIFYEDGNMDFGYTEYPLSNLPKDRINYYFPCILFDNKGRIALSLVHYQDLADAQPLKMNIVQFKGKFYSHESVNQIPGFDFKSAKGIEIYPDVIINEDGYVRTDLPESIRSLNKNAESDLFHECVNSVFKSDGLIPWSEFNPQDIEIEPNICYKFYPFYYRSSEELEYMENLDKLTKTQLPNVNNDIIHPEFEFGLKRIGLSKLPNDGYIYYIPALIRLNLTQHALGYAFFDSKKNEVLDVHIIRAKEQISVIYNSTELEDCGYFKDQDNFSYELLLTS
jgi:hypothetical protein